MYNKIVNPRTGRKININSPLAKKILKKYMEGGSTTKEEKINLAGLKFHKSELDQLLSDPKLHPIEALNKITRWVCDKMYVDTEYIKTLVNPSNMFYLIQDGGSGKPFLFTDDRDNDPQYRMQQRRASQEGHTDPAIIQAQERAFLARVESGRGQPILRRTVDTPDPDHVQYRLGQLANSLESSYEDIMNERDARGGPTPFIDPHDYGNRVVHPLRRDSRVQVLRDLYGPNVQPRLSADGWGPVDHLREDALAGRYKPVGSFGGMVCQWLVLIILFIFLVWFTNSNFFSTNPRD